MFGIMTQNGHQVLCHSLNKKNTYVLKRWCRNSIPVMRESSVEIDKLMQQYMVVSNFYYLSVFKFTQEQQEELLIKKLRNY